MGTVDLFHSRRTNYIECRYWVRDERKSIGDASKWIMENTESGRFYARELSPKYNQMNQAANVFAFDKNSITIETDDHIDNISRGCIVEYNGELWIVDIVQCKVHRKESEFNKELDYKYTINLRR